MAINHDAAAKAVTQGNLAALNRLTYSFPPDHGARLVTTVLTDDALRADWQAELEDVRTSMLDLRGIPRGCAAAGDQQPIGSISSRIIAACFRSLAYRRMK